MRQLKMLLKATVSILSRHASPFLNMFVSTRCKEYVRARVKNVHDRKSTRIAEDKPDAVFKVGPLSVQDYYV